MALKTLTVEGLETAIRQNAVVMYYASWCGHCKRAMPIYKDVASQLAEHGSPSFLVTKFNMDRYGEIVQRKAVGKKEFGVSVHEDVKGFPTFSPVLHLFDTIPPGPLPCRLTHDHVCSATPHSHLISIISCTYHR